MVATVQARLKRQPNNIIMMNIALRLLDLQCKIQGMFNIKTDVQGMIDGEINNYKQKVLSIIIEVLVDRKQTDRIIERLEEEGL